MRILQTHSSQISNTYRTLHAEELTSKILHRKWMLQVPDSKINQIIQCSPQEKEPDRSLGGYSFVNNSSPCFGSKENSKTRSFYVVRDDLLHPLVNGNKARKLDALFPLLLAHSVTDVVRFRCIF